MKSKTGYIKNGYDYSEVYGELNKHEMSWTPLCGGKPTFYISTSKGREHGKITLDKTTWVLGSAYVGESASKFPKYEIVFPLMSK